MSQEIFDNNTIAMGLMEKELEVLNANYNKTEALWISVTVNASTYKSLWTTLDGAHTALQKEYDGLAAIWPIYLFIAVVITIIIMFFVLRGKKMYGDTSEEKKAIETGYDQKASEMDKFSASGFVKKIKNKLTPEQRKKDEEDKIINKKEDEKIINEIESIIKKNEDEKP